MNTGGLSRCLHSEGSWYTRGLERSSPGVFPDLTLLLSFRYFPDVKGLEKHTASIGT